jgi:hypothetical protein
MTGAATPDASSRCHCFSAAFDVKADAGDFGVWVIALFGILAVVRCFMLRPNRSLATRACGAISIFRHFNGAEVSVNP